jgi:dipeptidyl-peptidase-4
MKIVRVVSGLGFLGVAGVVAACARRGGDSTAPVLAEAEERLRAIYDRQEFDPRPFRAAWLQDGSGYTILETPAGGDAPELVRYDTTGGGRTVLVSRAQLLPPGAAQPLAIEDYALSPDGGLVLLETNGRDDPDTRRRIADYWVLDGKSGTVRELEVGVQPGRARGAFSPDGRRVLVVRQHNLYVRDLGSGRLTPLTTDGVVGSVGNGVGETHPAYPQGGASWSPDGRQIAYAQVDSRAVPLRPMLDPAEPTYPKVLYSRFMRVGTPLPRLRAGVVSVEGGATRWISIPGEPGTYYLNRLAWARNSDELLLEKQSRFRDRREFLIAQVRAGTIAPVYAETDSAWINPWAGGPLGWVRNGRGFVLPSEKDGWRHAYLVSRDGADPLLLTPGSSDLISEVKVDEAGGWYYYLASPDNATQRYLYRVRLDGTGTAERVSPGDQPGGHNYDFSPDARWAFHTYSTFDKPPVIELVRMPEHRVVRVLEDNQALRAKMAPLITRPTEFFQLDIGGGVTMDAWMIKPRDFDPAKKYPVFVYVYGEPAGVTVVDDWSGGGHSQFHRTIADAGYLVVSIENRGTPAPKGAAWRRANNGRLGPLTTEEQAAGLVEMGRTRPYVDLSRVGIWGWSAGGTNTLNALFRKPDRFHLGIAVVPKPSPELYISWFQEAFMRTPEENPEGYRESAPIHYAEGLKGRLLLVHGGGETNTHLQIAERLVDRLIELGKPFDYMVYPNRDHNLQQGKGTPAHLRMLMARYLIEHLPPGPWN